MTDHFLFNALTYEGSLLHTAINFGLIAIDALALAWPLGRASRRWLICLGAAVLVQVTLWFVAHAEGVSIIWCMLSGALLLEQSLPARRWLARTALALDLAALVFYAIAFAPITSEAHATGIVLGLVIQAVTRSRGTSSRTA